MNGTKRSLVNFGGALLISKQYDHDYPNAKQNDRRDEEFDDNVGNQLAFCELDCVVPRNS